MKKLELKHSNCYLPYKVKVINIEMHENGFKAKHSIKTLVLTPSNLEIGLKDIDGIKEKLILHPLSDLTKYCEDLGFMPIEKLQSIFTKRLRFDLDGFYYHIKESYVRKGGDEPFPFNQLEAYSYLLEWHFDIHGLIETGLAIDINTL